jgi:hypothetical protein
MDSTRNPFNPGAGFQPPELAGRDDALGAATTAVERMKSGLHSRGIVIYGLRGVGKTVLLTRIEEIAHSAGFQTISLEADDDVGLGEALVPELRRVLRALSGAEKAKRFVTEALNKLRDVAAALEFSYGDVSVGVKKRESDDETFRGSLEVELRSLLETVGRAAQAAEQPLAILIDELQYLQLRHKGREFGALIAALHRVGQKNLPIIFFGAALPQIMGIAGNQKSYAERIFLFMKVGRLEEADAKRAIRVPIEGQGAAIDDDALQRIVEASQGYPYFLQEYGFTTWQAAPASPITVADVAAAHAAAARALDQSFFEVRMQRLSPKEKRYLHAMAHLGPGPYRSGDVAAAMGQLPTDVSTTRDSLIKKGMIWSPGRGTLEFTVPMFDAFMRRHMPGPWQVEEDEDPEGPSAPTRRATRERDA